MMIMKYVFINQFLNTGILFLLVNMDISEFTSLIQVDGLHPDFTITWYKDVGKTIINTMISNMFWPIIEFCMFFVIRVLKRLYDTMFCTRKT